MAETWRELYPFASRMCDLEPGRAERRMHYVDEGAGPPLLMVHGNPTWSFYYRSLVLAFRDRYRTIACDHLGCGLSDKPQDYPYTLAQHTENLGRLIDTLDLRDITLVVHDWGGAIGLGAAVARPDRIARLVILNTGAFPPPYIPGRILACRTPLLGRVALRGLNLFARAALTMATRRPGGLPPAVRAGLLAPYDSWRNRVAIWRFVRDIPVTKRHPTWRTLETLESRLSLLADRPVQLIWGLGDWCFDVRCLERFERHFPQARVRQLPAAGHYLLEDAPEDIVAEIERFLRET
jgi:haloalkane dehalogenase